MEQRTGCALVRVWYECSRTGPSLTAVFTGAAAAAHPDSVLPAEFVLCISKAGQPQGSRGLAAPTCAAAHREKPVATVTEDAAALCEMAVTPAGEAAWPLSCHHQLLLSRPPLSAPSAKS